MIIPVYMPYRLREIPSEKATLPEIADFMEYQCLKDESKIYSVTSGVAAMGIVADECSELGDDNDCDGTVYSKGIDFVLSFAPPPRPASLSPSLATRLPA